VAALAGQYVDAIVPDAAEVVAALAFEGIEVRIMSGGLLPAAVATGAVRWQAGGNGAVAAEVGGPVMMVGDGVTDLETRGVADVFVAYAGVVHRPAVVVEADVVIRSPSLAPVLPLALGGDPPRSEPARRLWARGLELLDPEYRAFLRTPNMSVIVEMTGRFFLPGPTEVRPAVLAAMTKPMIGHRVAEMEELIGRIQPRLQMIFRTERPVYISASSATG
jgi:hypothetical protein